MDNDVKFLILLVIKLGIDTFLVFASLYNAVFHMVNGTPGGLVWFIVAGLWFLNTCYDLVRYGNK